MKLVALPLTRARPNARPALVYYYAQLPPKPDPVTKTQIWTRRATDKALSIWTGWGQAPQGNWKQRVYSFGEKAQARLDFEELALKSIDPALGPHITSSSEGAKDIDALQSGQKISIPLIFPPSFTSFTGMSPQSHLRTLISHREPKHRRLFYAYVVAMPFTAPFMLIPVIPNLPFFFCVWRAWSNYRAYKAASYLGSLMDQNAIQDSPNPTLDSAYHTSSSLPSVSSDKTDSDVVLHRDAVPRLASALGLPSESKSEILHALEQAKLRLQKDASS